MKHLPYSLTVALLLSAAGCSKPAKPEVAPVPVTAAQPPAGTVAPFYRDPREQPRDRPECVAVRETFDKAKEAFEGFQYWDLVNFVHPDVPVSTLRRLAFLDYHHFSAFSNKPHPPDEALEALLFRHGVRWSGKDEPDAWKDVRDRRVLLTELLKFAKFRGGFQGSLERNFAGEARVYEISESRALVCVCPPRKLPPVNAAMVEFVKLDGKWLMNLIVDVHED